MLGVSPGSNWWQDAHLEVSACPAAMLAVGSTVPQSGGTSAGGAPPSVSSWIAIA